MPAQVIDFQAYRQYRKHAANPFALPFYTMITYAIIGLALYELWHRSAR